MQISEKNQSQPMQEKYFEMAEEWDPLIGTKIEQSDDSDHGESMISICESLIINTTNQTHH